jgi:putative flippase GtrA
MRPEQRHRRRRLGADSILAALPREIALLQFGIYVVVGGICFCIDIGGFMLLRFFEAPILHASATSFVAATLANHALCCVFVFRSGRFSRPEEMLRLFVIAIVGLGLNSAVVWFLIQIPGAEPTLAKVVAVLPVLAWNYLGRRRIVFDGTPSPAVAFLCDRVRGRP